jgi:membrane fusion protein (multidrug efflux system)
MIPNTKAYKFKKMKKYHVIFATFFLVLIQSCGGGRDNKGLTEKKAALKKLQTERTSLDEKIKQLATEISKLDTSAGNVDIAKLVAITPVAIEPFNHYIDLRGKIDAENISFITPRGMGGQVKAIFVKEGDAVKKGQLLLKLDDVIMRQSLAAARQQLEGIKTQLSFARNIYDRQNNLWQKGIGTEVQLISAKTNVESLQNQLQSVEEQVKVAAEQLNTTNVYSDVDGVAETVMVKVGELFGGMGQIKIVNTSQLKATAIVPENYITKVQKGTPVRIDIADAGKTINSQISLTGKTIENTQRGFVVESKIPADPLLKPNQSIVMHILDYASKSAVVIPVNTLQSDETNKFVYVLEQKEKGISIATRKIVQIGEVYGAKVEIKSGLTGGEQLITSGYQNLYEGQVITTVVNGNQ